MASGKLSSVSSKYEDHSSASNSLYGYSGYSASTNTGSVSTLASTSTRGFKPNANGFHGDIKSETSSTILSQRIRVNNGSGTTGHKNNYEVCKKVRVSMALIGIVFLVAAIFMLSFYLPKQYQKSNNPDKKKEEEQWSEMVKFDAVKGKEPSNILRIDFATNVSIREETPSKVALKATLGVLLTDGERRNMTITKSNSSVLMKFQDVDSSLVTLSITKNETFNQCFEVKWNAPFHHKLEDCFDSSGSIHWYGLGELFDQKWSLSKTKFKPTPFLTNDYIDRYSPAVFGGVLEPFVINSKGGGLYIDENVPLHISMNHNNYKRMCLRADPTTSYSNMYVPQTYNMTNMLKYTICIEENVKKVHQLMFDIFIEKPPTYPDITVIEKPIWSTWVRYKNIINESSIRKMADEIKFYNFEYSHFQIEGKYADYFGDLKFSRSKFEDVTSMLDTLKSQGFRVTVWVSPFANLQSLMFTKGLDHWVTVGLKNIPGITKWWDGVGGILDTTKEETREWFIKQLKIFQKLKISGFKFDAGETNFLPDNYRFSTKVPNPNYFSKYYVQMASQFKLSEVRVAYKCQKYPIYIRLLDRISYWKSNNGLKSVLPAVLTFSILGYPFVIPDMVGGNMYYAKPNRELYVRWAQLSAFLPTIQFSMPPWVYTVKGDQMVVDIVKDVLKIRKSLLPIIVDAAKKYNETGDPIIRPLWWYWPEDHEALAANTIFMLGDSYLVAPILHMNIITHSIYLPKGVWEEQWGKKATLNITTGEIRHYNVTLRDVCYFKLLSWE